jgi:LacI family transcriptional regulator, galactose operon repressor
MTKKNTTIYDIAEYLGISPATVSRAINNDVKISNNTIAKVRNAMQYMGYVPKPAHQRQGRRAFKHIRQKASCSKIIFLHKGIHSVQGDSMQFMEQYLHERAYSFEYKNYSPNVSIDSADGIILDFVVDDKYLTKLLRQKPTVQMFGHPGSTEIFWDQVTYDNSRVGAIAANYLLSQGHDVFAAFYPTNKVAKMRSNSFIKTVLRAKKRVKTYLHPGFDFDIELLEQQVHEISSLKSKPTGLFAFNDMMAISLHGCLLKAGIIPGKNVEIVACDNERNILSTINPRPATIEIHPTQIAKRTIEQLIWRLKNPYEQPVSIIIEPELIKKNKLNKEIGHEKTTQQFYTH